MKEKIITPGHIIVSLGIVLAAVSLLNRADDVAEGIGAGLAACGGTLIPALFPFMALSGFLSLSDYGRILSYPLRPFVRKLFRLPGELGPIILLGLIGGYPVGARSIANLLEQGRVDKKTAERMLCFCVNCGPSFLMTAVGVKMLSDRKAGIILFATQTAATLLVGILVSLRAKPLPELPAIKRQSGVDVFVKAVSGACSAMITMCAFAVLFSGMFSLIDRSGISYWIGAHTGWELPSVRALISGFFEVTGGCIAASRIPGIHGFFLLSLIVSFGGLSVIFQIMSCFGEKGFRFWPYLCTRPIHMALSAGMAMPLYRKYCATSAAWAPPPMPVQRTDPASIVGGLCLAGMCVILILATQGEARLRFFGQERKKRAFPDKN